MVTTLQDLLDDIVALADDPLRPAPPEAGLAVFAPAARALDRLLVDRVDHSADGTRQLAFSSLANACRRAADAWPDTPRGRLGELMATACDATGLLRFELNCAGRWATAVALSDAVEHAARLAQHNSAWSSVIQLRRIRHCTALVEQLAVRHPPRAADAVILNRPFPIADPAAADSAANRAVEAATAILDRLLRPHHHDELSLRQVLAITLAAEVAARCGTSLATSRVDSRDNDAPWLETGDAWRVARVTLARSFDDGTLRRRAAHDALPTLTTSAMQMHQALTRIVRGHTAVEGAVDNSVTSGVQTTVALTALIAQSLHSTVATWSRDGTLITRVGSPRLDENGHRRRVDELVRADRYDLLPVTTALSAASVLSSALSVELSSQPGGRSSLPKLAAAHQARVSIGDGPEEVRRRAEHIRRRTALLALNRRATTAR